MQLTKQILNQRADHIYDVLVVGVVLPVYRQGFIYSATCSPR